MELIRCAGVIALATLLVYAPHAMGDGHDLSPESLQHASSALELPDGRLTDQAVVEWYAGDKQIYAAVRNTGTEPISLGRVVLFRLPHNLPPETGLYGEGFTMLSQTGGTLGVPLPIGDYEDAKHYKIPQPADATTVYEMLLLTPPSGPKVLMGFTSCRRFVGRFHVRKDSIEVVLDTEGLQLEPGEKWDLENFAFLSGDSRSGLLDKFAGLIERSHPRLKFDPIPTGWCSWYCFGPMVTKYQVTANLKFVREQSMPLKYIQIDDGYQAAMGDWLDTGKAFGGGIRDVLKTIREQGCEPAIWVAPFVAEEKSKVFQEHPDWFIMDDAGKPLRSDRVTFGGWRLGPWYAIDGTHPEAQKHLENVFRTMRQEWGCSYFKLDANFWGAMHGGRFHDPNATRVEAYRRGMQAVLRGAGDGYVLGCNHPLWPSLGLIHGSRASGDISRSWNSFKHTARENFSRNWQNGRLWWNDPDCAVLSGKLPDNEFQFHATAIYACGGMTLSGDNLPTLPKERLAMLKKLLPPTGAAAQFDDEKFEVGYIRLKDTTQVCLFNWEEAPKSLTARLDKPCTVRDFWSGKDLGAFKDTVTITDIPPHSARLLACTANGA